MLATRSAVYATEALSDALWDEVSPLLAKHWHEVAHWKDVPLKPDREAYQRITDAGQLRVFTARVDGRLVGYLAIIIVGSLHYSVRMAQQDVLFVDPSSRGTRIGVELIRYAHDALRADGVALLLQHVKARADLNVGPMLVRLLGYELVDEIYGIRLDREG